MGNEIDLFLDDEETRFNFLARQNIAWNWVWVKTADQAKKLLEQDIVRYASLDHDLGACADCMKGRSPEHWLMDHDFREMPNCEHFGTGYTLLCWMEETGHWPKLKPFVHSRNGGAAERMRKVINKHYEGEYRL